MSTSSDRAVPGEGKIETGPKTSPQQDPVEGSRETIDRELERTDDEKFRQSGTRAATCKTRWWKRPSCPNAARHNGLPKPATQRHGRLDPRPYNLVVGPEIRTRATVIQQRTGRPVQFELMSEGGGTVDDYAFRSKGSHEQYGTHSLPSDQSGGKVAGAATLVNASHLSVRGRPSSTFDWWRPAMATSSAKNSASAPTPSSATQRSSSQVTEMLTPSEVQSLQQEAIANGDFFKKAYEKYRPVNKAK